VPASADLSCSRVVHQSPNRGVLRDARNSKQDQPGSASRPSRRQCPASPGDIGPQRGLESRASRVEFKRHPLVRCIPCIDQYPGPVYPPSAGSIVLTCIRGRPRRLVRPSCRLIATQSLVTHHSLDTQLTTHSLIAYHSLSPYPMITPSSLMSHSSGSAGSSSKSANWRRNFFLSKYPSMAAEVHRTKGRRI
jgi:hypothetical protein